ncbi:MAG: protein-glutamate O-methyltransferase CheR [Armatimonadota bacterium]
MQSRSVYNMENLELYTLLNRVLADRGLDFTQYRPKCIERRIASRMRSTDTHTYAEYAAFIKRNPEELDKLLNSLTINVTEFFRDKEVFDVLRKDILPDIIRGKEGRTKKTIRIWSAGCADGSEAYSVAMLLYDILGERMFSDFVVSIFATDIDREIIKKAQAGIYAFGVHLKNVDAKFMRRFFNHTKNSEYAVSDNLRLITRFKYHDLVRDVPLKYMDLILCRNVFIYFSRELQQKVFSNFYKSLNKDGYLVMGRIETVWGEMQNYFRVLDRKNKIYEKI